jgi:hypothetical protein
MSTSEAQDAADKELDQPPQSFPRIVVEDVVDAMGRCEQEKFAPARKRELIRAVFAAIEGLHWRLKQDVFRHAEDTATRLSLHERAALLEEAYTVDERGIVHTQSRNLPLPTAIRLVFNIVKRYRPEYELDFTHVGWSNLRIAIDVRNRLVHPKTLDDLTVSELEVKQAMSGFGWLLAFVIEVLQETVDDLKATHSRLSTMVDEARRTAGKPADDRTEGCSLPRLTPPALENAHQGYLLELLRKIKFGDVT